MSRPLSVLRVRNFRLHFAGQVISNVGTWFQTIAQALLILELTGSGTALGLVAALQFTPVLLLGAYGGTLADRVRPRRVLALTSVLAALLAATLAVVAAAGHMSEVWVYAVALALGCVQAFDRPAAQAFLYDLAGPDELPKAVALHSVTQSSARMVGPALGGLAYALLGSAACFAINALSFLGVLAALWSMRPGELRSRAIAAEPSPASVREGVRYALEHPDLRAPLLVNVFIGCLTFNFTTTITAMVRFELDGGAGALGAAHALNAAGAVLGSLLVASFDRRPPRAVLLLACCALSLSIFVNAISPSLLAFLCWAPLFGLSHGAYQTALASQVQRATAPGMQGRVAGLLALGTLGTMPIASLLAGFLIDAWSPRAAMGMGAAACAIGALALARPWRMPGLARRGSLG